MNAILKKLSLSLFAVLFLIAIPQIQGQTPELPGWYSQTPMEMSKEKCFETAKNALNSVGLKNQFADGNWSIHGINYNVRAGISCVSCGNGVHVSVVVAATNGYPEVNSLRDRLRDYIISGSSYSNPQNGTELTSSDPPAGAFVGNWTSETDCSGSKGVANIQITSHDANGVFSGKFLGPHPHTGTFTGKCMGDRIEITRLISGRKQNWNGILTVQKNYDFSSAGTVSTYRITGKLTDPTHAPCDFIHTKRL